MATFQTSIVLNGVDRASGAFSSASSAARRLQADLAAVARGIAPTGSVFSAPIMRGLAAAQIGVKKIGTGFRAAMHDAASGAITAFAPLAAVAHEVAENIKEIEVAKQGLQKSFLIPNADLADKSKPNVQEFDSMLRVAEQQAMQIGLFKMQDILSAQNEMRSRNLSTEQVNGAVGLVQTLASIKNEDLKETAASVLGITRGFFGVTRSTTEFQGQIEAVAATSSIMSKRLGLSIKEVEEFSKNAAPVARMLVHEQVAGIEAQMRNAKGDDLVRLEQQRTKILADGMNEALARAAALTQAGLTPQEAGNAIKAIYTRGVATTPKALAQLQVNGIDPREFQTINPELYNGQAAARLLSAKYGSQISKLAPNFDQIMKANPDSWFGARQQMLDAMGKNGLFKSAQDMKSASKALDMFYQSSVKTIDPTKMEQVLDKHHASIQLRKELAGMYHLPKAIDLTPQSVGLEMDTINAELKTAHDRMAILQDIAQGGLPGALKGLSSTFSVLSNSIGEAMNADVVTFFVSIRQAMRSVYESSKASPEAFKMITRAALGLTVALPAVFFLSALTAALGALVSVPVLAFAAGVYALWSVFSKLDKPLLKLQQQVGAARLAFDSLGEAASALLEGDFARVGSELSKAWSTVRASVADLKLGDVWSKLSGGQKIAAAVGGLWVFLRVLRLIAAVARPVFMALRLLSWAALGLGAAGLSAGRAYGRFMGAVGNASGAAGRGLVSMKNAAVNASSAIGRGFSSASAWVGRTGAAALGAARNFGRLSAAQKAAARAAGANAGPASLGGVGRAAVLAAPSVAPVRRAIDSLGPIASRAGGLIGGTLAAGFGIARGAALGLVGAVRLLFGPVMFVISFVSGLVLDWDRFKESLATTGGLIKGAFGDIKAAFTDLMNLDFSSAFGHLSDATSKVFSAIGEMAKAHGRAAVIGFSAMFGADGNAVWNALANATEAAWKQIRETIDSVLSSIKSLIGDAVSWISNAWESLDLAAPFKAAMNWADSLLGKLREFIGLAPSAATAIPAAPAVTVPQGPANMPPVQIPADPLSGVNNMGLAPKAIPADPVTAPKVAPPKVIIPGERTGAVAPVVVPPPVVVAEITTPPQPPANHLPDYKPQPVKTFADSDIRAGDMRPVRLDGPVDVTGKLDPVKVDGSTKVEVDLKYVGPIIGPASKTATANLDSGRSTAGN